MTASALYTGVVTHRRRRPADHALAYRIYMLLIDLDELPGLFGRLKLLARGRFGLMSFNARDHGDGSNTPLRTQVERHLCEASIEAGGPIRLLCMPRVLGHGFNPLSLYFCHRPDGSLAALLYEVSNTFGQRHAYLIPTPNADDGLIRQTVAKRFYVSPFMDMDLTYGFTVSAPGEQIGIDIAVSDATGPMLHAAFHGKRRRLTDASLLRVWLEHPLLTLKVVFGIHWEALKIWRKGVGFRHRPALPPTPVTVGQNMGEAG